MFKEYNRMFKAMIIIQITLIILVLLMILQNVMFYKSNFSNDNYVNQTVNVNTLDNKTKSEKININECSFEALENLTGIGEAKATKIISNRPYLDIYEIRKVVGDRTFSVIKDKITTKGD